VQLARRSTRVEGAGCLLSEKSKAVAERITNQRTSYWFAGQAVVCSCEIVWPCMRLAVGIALHCSTSLIQPHAFTQHGISARCAKSARWTQLLAKAKCFVCRSRRTFDRPCPSHRAMQRERVRARALSCTTRKCSKRLMCTSTLTSSVDVCVLALVLRTSVERPRSERCFCCRCGNSKRRSVCCTTGRQRACRTCVWRRHGGARGEAHTVRPPKVQAGWKTSGRLPVALCSYSPAQRESSEGSRSEF
jgi:hypothetical protein